MSKYPKPITMEQKSMAYAAEQIKKCIAGEALLTTALVKLIQDSSAIKPVWIQKGPDSRGYPDHPPVKLLDQEGVLIRSQTGQTKQIKAEWWDVVEGLNQLLNHPTDEQLSQQLKLSVQWIEANQEKMDKFPETRSEEFVQSWYHAHDMWEHWFDLYKEKKGTK